MFTYSQLNAFTQFNYKTSKVQKIYQGGYIFRQLLTHYNTEINHYSILNKYYQFVKLGNINQYPSFIDSDIPLDIDDISYQDLLPYDQTTYLQLQQTGKLRVNIENYPVDKYTDIFGTVNQDVIERNPITLYQKIYYLNDTANTISNAQLKVTSQQHNYYVEVGIENGIALNQINNNYDSAFIEIYKIDDLIQDDSILPLYHDSVTQRFTQLEEDYYTHIPYELKDGDQIGIWMKLKFDTYQIHDYDDIIIDIDFELLY